MFNFIKLFLILVLCMVLSDLVCGWAGHDFSSAAWLSGIISGVVYDIFHWILYKEHVIVLTKIRVDKSSGKGYIK